MPETPAPFTPPSHYEDNASRLYCVHTRPVGPDSCDDCRDLAHMPESDTCRPVEVDGETIRVRGGREVTEQERGYLAEIVTAARRRYAEEHPEPSTDACTEGQPR